MTWELGVAVLALVLALIALVLALRTHGAVRELRETTDTAPARAGRHAAGDDDGERDARPAPAEDTEAAQLAAAQTDEDAPNAVTPTAEVSEPERKGHPAFIVNPTRARAEDLRSLADRTAAMLGLEDVRYYETTAEDPGAGQARQAIEEGADVVIAVGGDGTVRSVASAMAHTGVPLGLVPMGTGNLLATNLGLQGASDRELLTIALTGRDRPLDMGVLSTEALTDSELAQLERTSRDDTFGIDAPTEAAEECFVVIGGVGFDAVMVGGVDDGLKRKLGIVAYPLHALRHLFDHKVHARMILNADNADALEVPLEDDPLNPVVEVDARSIMFANCGRLMSGITLVPNSQMDDGWLDVVVMDTRGGLKGWLDIANKVVLQGAGRRSNLAVLQHGRIDTLRARTASVRMTRPHPVQVDGDIIGLATRVHSRVEPDALLVRTAL